MKIFKLNNEKKRLYTVAIREHMHRGDSKALMDLCKAVDHGRKLTEEEFGILYYATAYKRQQYLKATPQIVVATMNTVNSSRFDELEKNMRSQDYENLLQDLYITLALSFPDGELYCKGSLQFTEEQYEERRIEIYEKIKELSPVANKVLGLDLTPAESL